MNNTAIACFIPITEFPEKRYRLMMEVPVRAPFELSAMVAPNMISAGRGHIIYIPSRAARHPEKPYDASRAAGGTVYGMAKAATERSSTGMAAEVYEHNVAVNAISLGLVATPGTELHGLVNENDKALQSRSRPSPRRCTSSRRATRRRSRAASIRFSPS